MLGRTNTGGGGSGGLNFQVIGGTTAPSNPKENMIWVNTSTKIKDYFFNPIQPGGVEGRVWIKIGTESSVAFNALKKNWLSVCPISAKQYVSGAWVDKTAKSYIGGKWVDWVAYYFLANGDYTGSWIGYAYKPSGSSATSKKAPTKTTNSDGTMKFSLSGTTTAGVGANPTKIDFSKYKTVCIVAHGNGGGDNGGSVRLHIAGSLADSYSTVAGSDRITGSTFKTYTIDVSAINTTGYLVFSMYTDSAAREVVVKEIYMV